MTALTDISPGVAGLQTRLVIETITQVVSGAEIVEIVGSLDETIPGFEAESWSIPGSDHALPHIRKRVVSLLGTQNAVGSFSCVVSGVAWGVLVEPIALQDGDVIGALVVARQGRAWSSRERALTKAFGGLLSHTVTLASRESALLDQRRLDELVGQVAERLMSASSRTRHEVLTWTTAGAGRVPRRRRGLPAAQRPPAGSERPGGRVAAPRRHPRSRTRSARCPSTPTRSSRRPRTCASRTCPERTVPARRVPRPRREGLGRASGSAGACVPLLLADTTWGVLGFLHFGLHAWTPGGDQRPAGHRLHARPAPGPHRRRGADRVHRPPRRPDRAAQPARPPARARSSAWPPTARRPSSSSTSTASRS